MSQNKCCVPGCKTNERPFHGFPVKQPHLFDEWLKRIGITVTGTIKFFHANRRVCNAHFNSLNKNSVIPSPKCAKLVFCSVPTIDVPGFTGEPTKENSFCFPPDYFKQAIYKRFPEDDESSKSLKTARSKTVKKKTSAKKKEPIDDAILLYDEDNNKTVNSEPVIEYNNTHSRDVKTTKSKTIISLPSDVVPDKDLNSEDSVNAGELEYSDSAEGFEDSVKAEEFDYANAELIVDSVGKEELDQSVIGNIFLVPPPAPRYEQDKPASFPLICRICATSNAYLIPIFGEEAKECDLGMKISSYLPLQVNEEDSVCFPCALTLISFHQLMINCKTANALFSLQPDDIQTKVIEPVPQICVLKRSEQCITIPTHSGDNSSCMEVCPLRWKEIIATTNTKYLTCHLCYESFLEFNQLKDHISDCKKIACLKCKTLFQNSEELNKHAKKCKKFLCDRCTRKFNTYTVLFSHTMSRHPDIKCPLCTKKFMNDLECEKHKTTEHNFLCECCNKTFPSSLPVMKHRLSIMPHGALMCLSCFGVSQFIPKIENQFIIEDKKALTTKFIENCSIPRLSEEGLTATNKDDVSSMMDAGENEVTILKATINGGRELNDHSYNTDNNAATCAHCSRTFSSENYLKMHILKHHPTEPAYRCEKCLNRFKSEKDLKIHSMYQCPHICSVCDTVVEGATRLKVHKQKHQLENSPLPCHLCNKVLGSKNCLNQHIKKVHKGLVKKILCFDCGKFIFSSVFKKHYDRHHNTEPVRCKYCLKTVASNLMSQHITENHTKGQFKCDICSRAFDSKGILSRHLTRMHNSSSSKSCVFCKAPFSKNEVLDKHIANHHRRVSFFVKLNNFDEYKCLHCEVVFDYTNTIDHKKMLEEKYGKLVNGPVKKYKVYVDPKSSLNKPNLDCITCGKQFASALSLQNHINDIHIALLKFKCSYCPRTFKRQSHKETHERIHTDERPYTCSICNKKFRQRGDCNRHVARHCNSLDRKQFVIFEKPKKQKKQKKQVELDQMNSKQEMEIDYGQHYF